MEGGKWKVENSSSVQQPLHYTLHYAPWGIGQWAMGNGLGGYEPASAYDQLGCIWDITVLLYEFCESAVAAGAVSAVNVCLFCTCILYIQSATQEPTLASPTSHLLPLLTYTPTPTATPLIPGATAPAYRISHPSSPELAALIVFGISH